jgi:hypothetical protein
MTQSKEKHKILVQILTFNHFALKLPLMMVILLLANHLPEELAVHSASQCSYLVARYVTITSCNITIVLLYREIYGLCNDSFNSSGYIYVRSYIIERYNDECIRILEEREKKPP